MRRSHRLKGNKNVEMPWEAVWFDTETKPTRLNPKLIEHRLNFGWAAHRRRLTSGQWSEPTWFYFEGRAEFWDWIESLLHGNARLYLFAHNGAFDLPVMDAFTILQSRGWKLLAAVIDSPPIILRWRRLKQTLQFIDTLNIWRMPLQQLGDSIGLHKLRMPRDDESRARWLAYGRRDVKVIMRACILWWEFLERRNLGGFAPTLASQAMRAFRHAYMDDTILIDDCEPALKLARDAYHGGRVDCFRIGKIKRRLWLIDVNSMYPYVMRDAMMPARLIGETQRATLKDLDAWLYDRCVIARCQVETRLPAYPVVHDNRLIFPVGRFEACLCTPELRYALAQGHVKSVAHVAIYEAAPVFKRFMTDAYAIRREAIERGDTVESQQIKTLTNSLYGKFGQNGRTYREAGHTDETDAKTWRELDCDTGELWNWRQLGGLMQVFKDEGESRDSHPAIAAHVTSGGRMLLWQFITLAGRRNVYYVDTDGLLVNDDGLHALLGWVDAGLLGHLKIERQMDYAVIRGAKDYDMGGVTKTKGVRKAARWLDGHTVEQEQWTSLKSLVRSGVMDAPRTLTLTKTLTREYTKGTVGARGWVLPLRLGRGGR